MSEKTFRKGDRVAWDTPQGKATGRVVEKLTSDKRIGNEGQKGTKVSASGDDPRYVVVSDKTGRRAAHRPRRSRSAAAAPDGRRLMADHDRDRVYADFRDGVNMTPKELERWLDSDTSKAVGEGSGESKGHRSGRRILAILAKNKGDLSDSDVDHMRRVNGYIGRHLAQRPDRDVEESAWRYSLMNWCHDPLK